MFVKKVRQEHTDNNDKALSVFHDLVVNQQHQEYRVKFIRLLQPSLDSVSNQNQ